MGGELCKVHLGGGGGNVLTGLGIAAGFEGAASCPTPAAHCHPCYRKEWSPVFGGFCVLVAMGPFYFLINMELAR